MHRSRRQPYISGCYQWHVVEASNRTRTWTVPRLQSAVKATFFGKAIELGKQEDGLALRYSDLKKSVSASEGPVADRTLSRALADLVRRGHLRRTPRGREVLYRLTIPRAERVAAFAKSDADAIRSAAQVGGIADLDESWAYYGIPEVLTNRVRGRLRRAGVAHRKALNDIIDRVIDETLGSIVRRGRGKLSRKTLLKVEDGLYAILEPELVGWLAVVRGQLVWNNIETMIPGALAATRRALGVDQLAPKEPLTIESLAALWSKILQVPTEEIRKAIELELRRLERYRPVLSQFFSSLSAAERELAGRELTALVGLIAQLTSVTRP